MDFWTSVLMAAAVGLIFSSAVYLAALHLLLAWSNPGPGRREELFHSFPFLAIAAGIGMIGAWIYPVLRIPVLITGCLLMEGLFGIWLSKLPEGWDFQRPSAKK
jgi:hypothetical protein